MMMKKKRMLAWLLVLVLSVLVPLPGMAGEVLAESTPTPPHLSVSGTIGQSTMALSWTPLPPSGWYSEWEVSFTADMTDTSLCGQVSSPMNTMGIDFADSSHPRDMTNKTVYIGVKYGDSGSVNVYSAWSNLYEVKLDKDKNIESLEPYSASPPTPSPTPKNCPDSPNGEHEWERKVKDAPTCTKSGTSIEVCSICGQEKPGSEETIAALEHQWERKVKVKPTDTKAGKSSEVCSVCGQEKPGSEKRISPLTSKNKETYPKTGESSGHYQWLALILLSAGGLIFLINKKRVSVQRD